MSCVSTPRVAAILGAAGLLAIAGCGASKQAQPAQTQAAKTRADTEREFMRCLDQQRYGGASTCWYAFLDQHGTTASPAELAYAKEHLQQADEQQGGITLPPLPGGIVPGLPPGMVPPNGGPEVSGLPERGEVPSLAGPPEGHEQFPDRKVGYEACYKGFQMTGNADRDMQDLTRRCGKPCGMLPMSEIVVGRQDERDRVDIYGINLRADRCYRFFAVGDQGVQDLDSALADGEGNILVRDVFNDAAPIIGPKEPYCPESDGRYKFVVSVARGGGTFKFQVWQGPRDTTAGQARQ